MKTNNSKTHVKIIKDLIDNFTINVIKTNNYTVAIKIVKLINIINLFQLLIFIMHLIKITFPIKKIKISSSDNIVSLDEISINEF